MQEQGFSELEGVIGRLGLGSGQGARGVVLLLAELQKPANVRREGSTALKPPEFQVKEEGERERDKSGGTKERLLVGERRPGRAG